MPVIVNGVELNDADLERELPRHADASNPMRSAITALVLRRVLLDEAGRQGLDAEDEEVAIGALLASEARAPQADEPACRRFYQTHPERFMVGELIEADHILFQVTPGVNLDMLRAHAKVVLDELMADPSRFAEVAREQSTVRRPRSAAAWASSGAATRCRSSSAPCSPCPPAACCRSCWKPATACTSCASRAASKGACWPMSR